MSYRPQFAFPTDPGCRDEDFVYYFDGSNVPLLAGGIAAGQQIDYIPLPLDQDAPFYWRGWKVGLRNIHPSGCPPVSIVSYKLPDFRIKLRDCYDNDLMDSMVTACECGFPQNPLAFLDQLLTGPPVALDGPDEGIYCPRGGVIQAFIRGGAGLIFGDTNLVSISLYGVKRYKGCIG